jgi:hypothetical protein
VRRGRRLEREACSRLGHCACGSTIQGWHGDGAGARARAWWRRLQPLGNYQAPARRTSASTLCAPLGRRGRAARWAERIGRAGPRRWEGAGRAKHGPTRWRVPLGRYASRPGGWREGGAGLAEGGPARRGCERLREAFLSLFLFFFFSIPIRIQI